QHLCEVATLEQLHGVVELARLELPEVEDLDHVAMIDRRCGLGLAFEPLGGQLLFGELRTQDLEGDEALQFDLQGLVHGAHTSATESPLDPVAPVDDGSLGEFVGGHQNSARSERPIGPRRPDHSGAACQCAVVRCRLRVCATVSAPITVIATPPATSAEPLMIVPYASRSDASL